MKIMSRIGVFFITLIAFAIPVLTALSFCFDWAFLLKGWLTVISVIDFTGALLTLWWFIEDISDI